MAKTNLSSLIRLIVLFSLLAVPALAQAPGGFVEKSNSTAVRPRLTTTQIQSFLPSRGPFTFPAPYNTRGIRLTNSGDCGGTDCKKCTLNQICRTGADCDTGVCTSGRCAAATCTDGVRNQGESDVDCGGVTCTPCSSGQACRIPGISATVR